MMESFLEFLYLKWEVILDTVTNLKPFLNINAEDGIVYYWFIIILKLSFVYHSQRYNLPKYLTNGLFALGNTYIAYNYAEMAMLSAIIHCVLIATSGMKAALVFSLFCIATSVNIKVYQFILDADVLLSMIWYAVETYREEKHKLAIVSFMQLGLYISSQSVFSFKMFWLTVTCLLIAYIPLKPKRFNKHRHRHIYFYALMFVWIVFKFQLTSHLDNQMLDSETKNVSVFNTKREFGALYGNNSSVNLATVDISSGKFPVAALVKNDFGEEHLGKSGKGSLKALDEELIKTTFETECSKETCTTNSLSKHVSEEDYAREKHRKPLENQDLLQNTQDYEDENDKTDEIRDINSAERQSVASKYSEKENGQVEGDSLVKGSPDVQEFEQIEDQSEIGTKEGALRVEFLAGEECKSVSIADDKSKFEKVDSDLEELELTEKDILRRSGEFVQNELRTQEELKSVKIIHEKKLGNDESILLELKQAEKGKIRTEEESTQNELCAQEGLKSMTINPENEFTKDEFDIQGLKLLRNEIKTREDLLTVDFAAREESQSKHADFENDCATGASNLQEFKLTENDRIKHESEKITFGTQEALGLNIVCDEKQLSKDHSNLREESEFVGEKKMEENSFPGVAEKCTGAETEESHMPKESHLMNTIRKNMDAIAKPMESVESHTKANSHSIKKRELNNKKTVTKERTAELHKPRFMKRKGYNFIENEDMHGNAFTTEAYVIEDFPVTESYETNEDEGMYLIYKHRRGKYYIL